jgi:uncharacterized protein YjiS (DUF1127 family)
VQIQHFVAVPRVTSGASKYLYASRGLSSLERAMSTMGPDVTAVRPRRESRWREVKQRFAEWRRRARSRAELMNLSDRCLQDIGMSRSSADFEASKPFWMA